ncbi:MAG TPA: substrate-binding domain-containing protein [Ktedonosporobacter sp.]|jgi:raffinose/stachyose/melibiose transport system substrate-binding protein|nr:substrate-binding domain-containing protein [Ktedonosporobacter sp.]
MMNAKMSRRTFLEVTGGAALTTTLAGCFGVGSSQSTGTGSSTSVIEVWDIRTGNEQKVVQAAAAAYNSLGKAAKVHVDFFENDPYKQKLQVAMGAKNPPDVFFGWGGGILKSYVDAGDVYDLTPDLNADPTWKNKFFPSVLSNAAFNGKFYGIPNAGMQTELFFYNKDIFSKYKLNPPATWSELLNIINVLKSNNVIPIALAGGSQWPYLMYAEFLVDRIGGAEVFNAVFAGQANAWSDPAFIKANTMIQDLVKMGAFGTSYTSTNADSNQDAALVYTGKAGMMLQGNWNYSVVQTNSPDFITSGKLGWFPFPAVEGGKGDPKDVYGNPCNFYSVASTSKSTRNAVDYLKNGVLTDKMIKDFINVGDVPPVQGLESQLATAPNSEWLLYNYNMAKNATNFQLSWDQVLSPTQAQASLTNLSQVFLNQISPVEFSNNMNKTINS